MGREIHPTARTQPFLANDGIAEEHLCSRDTVLAEVIRAQMTRWNPIQTEDVLSGLIRIVISQQISTSAARTIAARLERAFPDLKLGNLDELSFDALRSCGVSPRKASCCIAIAESSICLRADLTAIPPRYDNVQRISGIGRWTIDVLRIMILKELDIVPNGDLGLQRAISNNYSELPEMSELAQLWSPFGSVACWYLWRSLGNPPLG